MRRRRRKCAAAGALRFAAEALEVRRLFSLPATEPDFATTPENQEIFIDVTANDPSRGSVFSGNVTTAPAHGSAGYNENNTVSYTPPVDFVGTDTFEYEVVDETGQTSLPTLVTVTVTPVPVTAASFNTFVAAFYANPVNVAAKATGVAVRFVEPTVTQQPLHGTATTDSQGDVIYTPTDGYLGTDQLSYTVTDGYNGNVSAPAVLTFNVVRADFIANPIAAQTNSLTPVLLQPLFYAGGHATDPATGDIGSYVDPTEFVFGTPKHGTLDVSGEYTPDPLFTGVDTVTFTVGDGHGDNSVPQTATITVTAPPAPVLAAPVTLTAVATQTSSAVTINPMSGVTSGLPLAATTTAVTVSPIDGTAVVQADGSILYTANPGFVGTDSVGYTIDDAQGQASPTATVTVVVPATLGDGVSALTFVDDGHARRSVSLSGGSVSIGLSGTGQAVRHGNRMTITGGGQAIVSITLAGTNARSILRTNATAIGTITDASPMGSIVAPDATVGAQTATGSMLTSTFTELSALRVKELSGAQLDTTGNIAVPLSLFAGGAVNSNLVTTQFVRTLRAGSWLFGTNGYSGAIYAPAFGSVVIDSGFNVRGQTLVGTSNEPSGSLTFGGGFAGSVQLSGAVKTFTVRGDADSASIVLGLQAGGRVADSVVITGTLSGSTISSGTDGGSLGSVTVGSMIGSSVVADILLDPADYNEVSYGNAQSGNLGDGTIGRFAVSDRNGGMVGSEVLARTIGTAALGQFDVTPDSQSASGIAAVSLSGVTGVIDGRRIRLTARELAGQAAVDAYLTRRGLDAAVAQHIIVAT